MDQNDGFCKSDDNLPDIRCDEWLGGVFAMLNPDALPVAQQPAKVEAFVGDDAMANPAETIFETHIRDTHWKVLAENVMESCYLPVCHAGTRGARTSSIGGICHILKGQTMILRSISTQA